MSQTASKESIWASTPLSRSTIETHSSLLSGSIGTRPSLKLVDSMPSQQIEDETEGNQNTEYSFEIPKVERRLPTKFSNVKSQVLQKWVGNILRVDDSEEEFLAQIKDVTNPNMEDEYVTISYGEISTFDLASLKVGAIFYWTIGYKLNGETKSKFSEINFQRLVLPRSSFHRNNSELEELQALFADAD